MCIRDSDKDDSEKLTVEVVKAHKQEDILWCGDSRSRSVKDSSKGIVGHLRYSDIKRPPEVLCARKIIGDLEIERVVREG